MLFIFVNLRFGEHCFNHLVNILIGFVVAPRFLIFKVKTHIATSLMSQLKKVDTFLEAAEDQKGLVRLFKVCIAITDVSA